MTVTITQNTRLFPEHTLGEWGNNRAFAVIKSDGSVVTWGDGGWGGDNSTVAAQLNGITDVTQIFSTTSAFAALRGDGSVVTWGGGGYGGAVAAQLDGTVDVTQIFSTYWAFAALRSDGSVVTWGDGRYGGDSSAVTAQIDGAVDVTQLFSTSGAFAALRSDGSVATWGYDQYGGGSGAVAAQLDGTVDVTQIFSTGAAFAALRSDGSVVTWGDDTWGGDSGAVAAQLDGTVDVTQIFSTGYAFAALHNDGSVVTWGDGSRGGDSSAVAAQLDGTVDVTQIFSTDGDYGAFAALRSDGSVVTWGHGYSGGNSSAVAAQLVNVTQIFSTGFAFAALRSDGSVVTWGGGLGGYNYGGDSSAVAAQLDGTVDVVQIFSTERAFAALRGDGSVVTWGVVYGGNSSAVAAQLDGTVDVTQVFSTHAAFAALRTDGSVVAWGASDYGGDSSTVASQLSSGVVGFANIYTNDVFSNPSHTPVGTDKTITLLENGVYTLTAADFGFTDPDDSPANTLQAVKIATLPAAGTLKLSGVAVSVGQSVSAADLAANLLTFAPVANRSGANYASFTFQVQDDGGTASGGVDLDPTADTITLNVSDITAPTVLVFSPADGSSGALNSSNIVLTFSEAIARGVGSIVLKDASGAVIETFDAAASNRLALANSTLTLDPSNVLDNATQYFVDFPAGLVTDLAGNSYAGIASYDFTTQENRIVGTVGDDDGLIGTALKDSMTGLAGDDTLLGLAGNDTLDGGSGDDILVGGKGNDTYIVNSVADVAVEQAKQGTDTVQSSVSYTLSANVENLVLTGAGVINGTGNGLANTLTGNGAANILDGGTGADTLTGGNGGDTYSVDHIGDVVSETNAAATGGTDSVYSYLASYALGANIENLRLLATGAADGTGNTLNNVIYAGTGNNVLDGAAGTDTVSFVYAKAGITANLGVTTAQTTGGSGSDTLLNFENLTGSNFNDTLTGNSMANVLDGGTGVDKLTGGDGNDAYYADHIGDVVSETNAVAATGGTDIVFSYLASYALGANVENLRLLATGTANGIGNALNNLIYAGAGNNVLDGAAGTDTVSFVYAKAGITASLGLTTAQATGGSGSDTLLNFENLTGSNYNDTLAGNSGNNALTGGSGDDTLIGSLGKDALTGGLGADIFKYNATMDSDIAATLRDSIKDFSTAQGDKINLSALDANAAALGNQAFSVFSQGAAFAGSFAAQASLFFDQTAHVLYGNNDADAAADFSIGLVGVGGLAATDFVL